MVFANWSPSTATGYHIAVTRASGQWTLYVDGAPIGTSSWAADIPAISAEVRLGYSDAIDFPGKYALDGALDEVAFFHRALTAGEVASLYNAGSPGLCAPVSSALTLTASKSSITLGQSVTLSGALTLGGSLSAVGREVRIDRAMGSGSATTVATVTTGAGGTFSWSDSPPKGTAHYTAWFEGGDNAVPASATATVSVVVHSTALRLSASERRLALGDRVRLTARLTGAAPHATVSVFGQPYGQRKRLVFRGETDARGVVTVPQAPKATTTYTASHAGETGWLRSASKPVSVTVAGRWSARSIGGYATSGKYRLYH